MATPHPELIDRVAEYCRRRSRELLLDQVLGFGAHGSVFVCRDHHNLLARNAVKVHERGEPYSRERDVYLRLAEVGVDSILGHAVPQLIDFDDKLLVIEMSIVTRPFLLDFGGAYLDKPPEFGATTMAEWRVEKEEQFEANWAKAAQILATLRRHGIYVMDVNPGNIGFVEKENPK